MWRYVARKAGYYDDPDIVHMPDSMMVHEEDEIVQDTGLLDQHGTPLVRMWQRQPIGFQVKPVKRVKAGRRET